MKNLLLVMASIIFALLAAEAAIRLILIPLQAKPKWSDRPEYYYSDIRPAREDPNPKAEGVFRLAVVGDSISYGPYMQFDDTYARRLERMFGLNANGKKLEVVNYAQSGLATLHEVQLVKRAVDEGADSVLLQITLNDAELTPINLAHEITIQRFGPLRLSPFLKGVTRYWKTLGFVLARLHNSHTRVEYKKYFFELFNNPQSWNVFRESLEKIKKITDEKNVPLAVVVFPLFGENIDASYPFSPIHQKIGAALEELKITHLDLLDSFQNIPAPRLQVIPGGDFHPNEIGHRIAAEKLYRWLLREKFVPEDYRIAKVTRRR